MNNFRLDLIFERLYDAFGPIWLVVAIGILVYTLVGPMLRATMTAMCVLLCTQLWFPPLHFIGYFLRWSLLLILCFRGLKYMRSTPPVPGERHGARNVAVSIGVLALLSIAWSADSLEFTAFTAGSFCMGLVVTFGLLWRLADGEQVMQSFVRASLLLALLLFGGGFLVAGVSYSTGDWVYFNATHFDVTESGGRYSGLFFNPNAAGLIGTMLLPIVVAAPRDALGRLNWLRLPVCALIAATIFLSGSRSAVLGAGMSLAVLGLYRFGAGAFVTLLLGGTLGAVAFVAAPVEDLADDAAVAHITRTKHLSTLSGRLELWQMGWDAAQGHLALGQGWSHSRVLGDIDTEAAVENGAITFGSNLHNAHLQLLIDVGFVGVALFWLYCALVIRAGFGILTAPKSPENAVGVVIFTSVLSMLADTFVHGAIWSMGSPTTLAFWGLCVMTLKQAEKARLGSPREAERVEWRPSAVPLPA